MAGKRWLTRYGEAYRWLKPARLGEIGIPTSRFAGRFRKRGIVVSSRAKIRRIRGRGKRYPGAREGRGAAGKERAASGGVHLAVGEQGTDTV
ncbi:MAG: hypothetical protein LBD47_12745 [Treponema sp.]|nr:hypothetical protein [Treponema sp.]